MKTRITTQNKTQEAIASREIANKLSASKPKTVKSNNNITFTQKDLLLEALSTEIDNTRWLERHKLECHTQEQLKSKSNSIQFKSGFKRMIHRRGCNPTITWSDYDSMPWVLKL